MKVYSGIQEDRPTLKRKAGADVLLMKNYRSCSPGKDSLLEVWAAEHGTDMLDRLARILGYVGSVEIISGSTAA
jgi:hypothetical protein